MAQINTKIGDVFAVQLNEHTVKYFQYIANDLTQLNSDVIRAFEKAYPINVPVVLSDLVCGEVDFYAHTVIKWGIKSGLWVKVGNVTFDENPEILFRGTKDYGTTVDQQQVKISTQWYVWKINGAFQQVGKLEGEYQKAEIGVVIPAIHIVHRLKTGKYDFYYPGFE